jgi:hypothetical protein
VIAEQCCLCLLLQARQQVHLGVPVHACLGAVRAARAVCAAPICATCVTAVLQVAQDAACDARSICAREYGSAPDVHVLGDTKLELAYVPGHLQYMVSRSACRTLQCQAVPKCTGNAIVCPRCPARGSA